MRWKQQIAVLSVWMGVCTACTPQVSSRVYSSRHVGEASATYPGVVVSVQEVLVEESDRMEDHPTGVLAGGLLGAGAGSMVGKGKGNFLTTAGGAVAGAIAGSFVEKKLKEQTAFEYVVQLDSGSHVTIVQGGPEPLEVGAPVFVLMGNRGRSRLIAR